MRIGVYVDGFNLYYGGRRQCGRGTSGWRWLDLRGLAEAVLTPQWRAADAQIERVVYCTARVVPDATRSGARDQETYLTALRAAGSVDLIEFGTFVSRVRRAFLAKEGSNGRPVILDDLPRAMGRQPGLRRHAADGTVLASYAQPEQGPVRKPDGW